MNKKQNLFTIPFNGPDIEIKFYKSAKGPGGQAINKTSSACRVTHYPSGAIGDSKTHRSQIQNKKEAIQRMVDSKKFKAWLKLESASRLQGFQSAEKKIDDMMKESNLKIETKDDKGKWTNE